MYSTKSAFVVRRNGKCTVFRRVGALFSLQNLQAGTVKGLTMTNIPQDRWRLELLRSEF